MSKLDHEAFRIRAITERIRTRASAKVIAERLTVEYGRPITKNAICGVLFRARKSGQLAEVAKNLAEAFRARVIESHRQTGAASADLARQFGVTKGVIRGILRRAKAFGEPQAPEPQPEPQPEPVAVPEAISYETLRALVLEAHQKPGVSRRDTAARLGTRKAVVDGILRQRAKAAKTPPGVQQPEPPPLVLESRSDEDRAALRLRAEGLSCAAISRRIGLKPKAVESRLSRLADRGIATVAQYDRAEARGEIRHLAGPRVKTELNRAVLERRAEGKTGPEIGRDLGLSKDVVEGVVSRARKSGDPRAEKLQPPAPTSAKKGVAAPQQQPRRPMIARMISPFEEDAKAKKEAAARAQAHADRISEGQAKRLALGLGPQTEADLQQRIRDHLQQKGVTQCEPMGLKSSQSEFVTPSSFSRWRAGGL